MALTMTEFSNMDQWRKQLFGNIHTDNSLNVNNWNFINELNIE